MSLPSEFEKKLAEVILRDAIASGASCAEMQASCNIAMRAYSAALKAIMNNFTSPELFEKAQNYLDSVPTEVRSKT